MPARCAEKRPRAPREPFHVITAASYIAIDTLSRVSVVTSRVVKVPVLGLASLLPRASAIFTFGPQASNDTASAEDAHALTNLFDFHSWRARGSFIRSGQNRANCLGNLSLVLSQAGPLVAAETSGASGALSLLPTAGALIGAPAKELWVVYKLMPLAGVLSMLLSLGGNIVPTQTSEYELKTSAFSYGGFIATSHEERVDEVDDMVDHNWSDAKKFARRVECRAKEPKGSRKRLIVGFGIFLQCFWLTVLLAACWFTQSGSVVVWWCQAWGWMLFWYLTVAISSVLENIAGVPFTKQWTLRISKAPDVRISEDAPIVAHCAGKDMKGKNSISHPTITHTLPPIDISPHSDNQFTETKSSAYATVTDTTVSSTLSSTPRAILSNLEAGYNTTGRVIIDRSKPWSASRVPFYVIISLEGISHPHATFRVISKAISVGVYAAGTATFASATLITISVALTVLCLVLGAGVFGRVVAMWMASEMMKTDPVLHRVVKTRDEAADYIESILAIPGLTCEVMGHVIVNGRCIKRYNKWFRMATFFGVLAPPYDISKLAVSK
ncbi:MAG: hypothetical protein M1839_005413 [Geoglossum umbratile]|nr:MAG: hypothetical protein M1839_005413 [Geoglossum umbratile]